MALVHRLVTLAVLVKLMQCSHVACEPGCTLQTIHASVVMCKMISVKDVNAKKL
jgi:hypothetical protein